MEDYPPKYKAVKDFITDILEIDTKTVAKPACTIEHSISSQVVERLIILKQLLIENSTCGIGVLKKLHDYIENRDTESDLL